MATVALRNKQKAKKPSFPRQQAHMLKQLKGKWNKPRGIHSKIRNAKRGKPAMPKIGYSSPRNVHGLTYEGKVPVVVATLAMLEKVNVQNEVAIISGTLGMRKRVILVNKALEKKIPLYNIKDSEAFLKTAQARFEEKKQQHKAASEQKKKAIEELEKKAAEKATKETAEQKPAEQKAAQ